MLLVEAFVTHDTSEKTSKRRKTQDDPSSGLPVVSHGTSATLEDPLIHAFQVAAVTCDLLVSPSLPLPLLLPLALL
mgnify:CR=1 FL=1